MRTKLVGRLLCLLALLSMSEIVSAQGTAFTYQGRLNDGGSPATGNYDLMFALFDASTNGNAIGPTLTNAAVPVANGLFTTNLDFGTVFTGPSYWLSVGVRTNGSTNAFTVLWPRQALLPVPYAIFANSASNLLGTLTTTQLVGTLPASAFAGYTNTVSFTNGADLFSGTFTGAFSGNGLNLTNLNGSAVAVGTVADARLSSNVAFLNGNQTFSGGNNMTNWGNNFTGSFFGNGLVGWIVETATNVAATVDAGFVLTASNVTTVALPTPLHIGDIVRISGAGPGGWRIAQSNGVYFVGNFLTYNNGSWLPSGASSLAWVAICSSASGNFMAAAPNDGSHAIYYSTDGGLSWSASASISSVWRSIACSASGSQLVAGQGSSSANGSLYYSTNSGLNWTGSTNMNTPTSGLPSAKWYSAAMSANGSNAVAVAYGGVIYSSPNGGAGWYTNNVPTANWQSIASSSDGTHLAAAVNGGRIYTSSNSGGTWVAQTGSPATNWIAVVSSADGRKLAGAVYAGGVYTSGDYGVTWTQQLGSNSWECLSCSADGGKLAAAAYGGHIYASDDFGATWSQQNTAINNWVAITSSSDGGKLAACIYNGGIYYSSPAAQFGGVTNGTISGVQGSAVELQYIGNNQWMPVSSTGTIWTH